MPIPTDSGSLTLDRPDDVGRVRDTLGRVGYDFQRVYERVASRHSNDLGVGPRDRPRVLRLTRDGDPQATLIRLFLIGEPIPLVAFRRAVAPMVPEEWAGLGLVEIEADTVHRRFVLKPIGPLFLVHDVPPLDSPPRRDQVMGISGSTLTFASTVVRRPARWALDLGTGSGYLALLAAAHSQHVLATDVNTRAVAMARFNAMLNRTPNVEVAQGNLFEPAGDLRFDLIGSNPPFVVSPQNDLIYRDSGLQGDAICERIIRGAPAHLAEGGFAQVLCNWIRVAGQDWLERLSGWFDGSECDVWIIHRGSTEPGDYAQHWLGQGEPFRPDGFADDFERWMNYYEQHRIEAIDSGIIALRRRTGGRNWMRVDTDCSLEQCGGAGILVGFAARDLMDRLGDDRALLDLRLLCRPELRLSQRLKPADSGWMVAGAECSLGDGLRFNGEVTPVVFHLLSLCRGQQPLSAVLSQVASRLGQDVEAIREDCLGAVRSLALQGFLWPVDMPLEPPGLEQPGTRGRDESASG